MEALSASFRVGRVGPQVSEWLTVGAAVGSWYPGRAGWWACMGWVEAAALACGPLQAFPGWSRSVVQGSPPALCSQGNSYFSE